MTGIIEALYGSDSNSIYDNSEETKEVSGEANDDQES